MSNCIRVSKQRSGLQHLLHLIIIIYTIRIIAIWSYSCSWFPRSCRGIRSRSCWGTFGWSPSFVRYVRLRMPTLPISFRRITSCPSIGSCIFYTYVWVWLSSIIWSIIFAQIKLWVCNLQQWIIMMIRWNSRRDTSNCTYLNNCICKQGMHGKE